MCYGSPAKSLEIARARTTPEQWSAFEREFSVFCDIHGLPDKWAYWPTYDWAKWAFWSARPRDVQSEQSADICGHCKTRRPYHDLDCPAVANRVAAIRFERIAIAMITDEQAEASLERWMSYEGKMRGVKGEAE